MRIASSIPSVLLISLMTGAAMPGVAPGADAAKFDSPAAVVSAAEDAYGREDYKAYAACFDAAGLKAMNVGNVQLLVVYAGLTPDGHGKDAKNVLAKYGVTDLTRKDNESDDQFADRLVGQLTDPAAFLAEAAPIAVPNPDHKKFTKGVLKAVKIDGTKATASYQVKPVNSVTGYTQSEDVTFVQSGGSWKISGEIDFVPPGT